MAASGYQDAVTVIAALIRTIDKADLPRMINACSSLKSGDFIFLEQIVDATCQAGYDVILGRLHPAQIKLRRSNRNAKVSKCPIRCLGKLFRCVEQCL